MGKYYSRKPTRLKGFDYSSENLYFVTICVHEMACIFGKIVDYVQPVGVTFTTPSIVSQEFPDVITRNSPGEMVLSPLGEVLKTAWEDLSQHFPITLYNFQIMPNHIHGLIQIEGEIGEACRKYFERINLEKFDANIVPAVENLEKGLINQAPTGTNTNSNFVGATFTAPSTSGVKIKLGEIVRSFKAKASKQIHESGLCDSPIWQRNYHDHIVRDDDDYSRIAGYIIFNPKVWDRDRNNPCRYRV